ncbi:DUF2169 domain-containing protein [Yoonia sp. SS1-5]|uniref:DUF2169 domain-containing protein n=1 Tax=Yoonia rhodophyticola TaxID=3137370 RepID=A0AAN0M739_9RHOB
MKLSSELPLSHTAFAHWHTDDTEVGVVIAKAAFSLTKDGTSPVTPPPEFVLADEFTEAPEYSPLLHEQDIAPFKPKTDLIIRGTARSFEAKPRRDWAVTVAIPDQLYYGFQVRGPSRWIKMRQGWQLSQADEVTEVPLTYALAYGGHCQEGETTKYFEQNPAGLGFMTETAAEEVDGWPAPQIGLLAEFLDARPFEPMAVHGTMPLAKAWLPRRANAGTFDKEWERDRHPRMPLDYDLAFWNAAPLRLQIAPHMVGNETIEISGLSHRRETVSLGLPGAKLALKSLSNPSEPAIAMALDTVDINVDRIDDGQIDIVLLWRTIVRDRSLYTNAEIIRG